MLAVVAYTTLYREGGEKFRRAARTLTRELEAAGATVRCEAVESKRDFVDLVARATRDGARLDALHFLGHGGMYGPMFRTTAMPEQFSPHEWRTVAIPFADGAQAYFHCCRSARFFAPFFARTFGVRAHGHALYTTVSRRPDRYAMDLPFAGADAPLWVVSLPGRKSHGLVGAAAKHAGLARLAPMRSFDPPAEVVDASYDPVATLYDRAFADIGVRGPEVAFIEAHLPAGRPRVVELGTGNGALLARLAPRIATGLGLDASPSMLDRARSRFGHLASLTFTAIDGPTIPAEDASVDVVVSMLSWRYLDWDPMMAEIRRVLAPGGRLLVVDMVALPAKATEAPRMLRDKAAQWAAHARRPAFRRDLKALVADPRWAHMLRYNPMRAEHEYRWYFESRFPGRTLETLTVGWTSRIVAFDTGPLPRGFTLPQSYP